MRHKGEWSGHFATFALALAEAKESNRDYEIAGAQAPDAHKAACYETAVFPRLNKRSSLAEVKEEIRRSSYTSRIRVEESYTVSDYAWSDLSENFMSKRDVWSGRGGVDSTYTAPGALAQTSVLNWPDDERKRWMAESFLLVIEIVHEETGERFFVDAQGYDYARYVGVPQ